MILEEMFNGRFYPCETVVADSPRFKQAVKASADLMDTLSERLSKDEKAVDAVSGATLVDTAGYVGVLVDAAK